LSDDVDLIDGGTIGFELVSYFQGRKKIVIIDSLREDAEPGSVFRLTLDEIHTPLKPTPTAHDSSIDLLLQYAKSLSPQPEVIVIGIVPECMDRLHLGLSKRLEERLESITELVERES
jgi:hydrogenase maturation protease